MTHAEAISAMIDQFRETFEHTRTSWITDGQADSGVLGYIDSLSAAEAMAEPAPGARSIAGHVAHLRFVLDLLLTRMHGRDPGPADWAGSYTLPGRGEADWRELKASLREVYEQVRAEMEKNRARPLPDWPGEHLAGLCATVGHSAYHLGSIRQIGRVVRGR